MPVGEVKFAREEVVTRLARQDKLFAVGLVAICKMTIRIVGGAGAHVQVRIPVSKESVFALLLPFSAAVIVFCSELIATVVSVEIRAAHSSAVIRAAVCARRA